MSPPMEHLGDDGLMMPIVQYSLCLRQCAHRNLYCQRTAHDPSQVACKLVISVTLVSHQINSVLYFVKYALL